MSSSPPLVSLVAGVEDAVRRAISVVLPGGGGSAGPPSDHADLQANAALPLARIAGRPAATTS